MKKTLPFLITSVFLIFACIKVTAQKDTSSTTVYKVWDDFMTRIKKEKNITETSIKSLAEQDPTMKTIREQLDKRMMESLSAKENEEPWKEYSSTYQHKSGDMNLFPLLEEAPLPVYILPQAGQTDVEARFNPYIQKIEGQQKQLADMIAKDNKIQQVYQQEGEEGLKKRSIAESDKSKIIQQMGGTENLMKMSEGERKEAAMKMANDVKNNPGMLSGGNNPGINAMMQKMMSDKEYMNRYNKMSQAEKEAELKKFMSQNPLEQNPGFDAGKNNQQHDKLISEKNEAKYTQDIILLTMRMQKRLGAATELYGKNIEAIQNWTKGVKDKIGKWYSARYASIPIVELGEYGHDKDPGEVKVLDITVAWLNYFLLETPELQMKTDSWKQYKNNCKYAIAELNDFIAPYKWGNSSQANIFGPDADQQLAAGIGAAYGLMTQLADEAKGVTSIAKSYQKHFERVLGK